MIKLGDRLEYIYDERKCINVLIKIVFSLNASEFKNCSIDNHVNEIFIWGRQLTRLEENLERYKIIKQKKIYLKEMAFDIVEDRAYYDFCEEYKKQGSYEKFEDYKIQNINIQKQIEKLNVSPAFIKECADQIIQDNFGFNFNALRKVKEIVTGIFFSRREELECYISDDNIICARVGFPKEIFYEACKLNAISQDEIDKIFQIFSFENKEIHEIELSCFYLLEDVVYFGPCDMFMVFDMFEKFSLSGYFLECYKKNINFVKLLNPCQKRVSTYMTYILADILVGEGYKMHMETFGYEGIRYCSPRTEIKNISSERKNILKDAGDIDILFLDNYKKQVICVEYKYFQPAISYEESYKSDRNKITKQLYEKNEQIQRRENIVRENIKCVVEFLGGSGDKYDVKTIVVLARPNMYVFTEESSERIEYEIMTMNKFCEQAILHDL